MSLKYDIDVHTRCVTSQPCLWTNSHWAFLSLYKFTAKVLEMWKATFSSKYATVSCASLRTRNSCESPAAACAVPAGQAESTPWPRIEEFSHKAASGEVWQGHLLHTMPQLHLMWLCPCSCGVNARKESSLQHLYQKWNNQRANLAKMWANWLCMQTDIKMNQFIRPVFEGLPFFRQMPSSQERRA